MLGLFARVPLAVENTVRVLRQLRCGEEVALDEQRRPETRTDREAQRCASICAVNRAKAPIEVRSERCIARFEKAAIKAQLGSRFETATRIVDLDRLPDR